MVEACPRRPPANITPHARSGEVTAGPSDFTALTSSGPSSGTGSLRSAPGSAAEATGAVSGRQISRGFYDGLILQLRRMEDAGFLPVPVTDLVRFADDAAGVFAHLAG